MLTQSHMGVTIWLQQEAETFSILSIWTGESRWQTTDPEEFTFHWESCHQQLPQVTTEMSSVAFPLSVFFCDCAMKEYRARWKSGIFPLCKLFRTEKFNQSSQCKMVHTFSLFWWKNIFKQHKNFHCGSIMKFTPIATLWCGFRASELSSMYR